MDVFRANSNEPTALPIETNVSFHTRMEMSTKRLSLQAGNESLRLVATIAAYFAAIVGLCGRSPNCPRLNATYAFNRGYQKCPNSSHPLPQGEGESQDEAVTESAVSFQQDQKPATKRLFQSFRVHQSSDQLSVHIRFQRCKNKSGTSHSPRPECD